MTTTNQSANQSGNEIRTGKPLEVGSFALVNMFDQTIKGSPGKIIGSGVNSAKDTIYLVEMMDTKLAARGRQDGCAQIEHGKAWVLSLYGEELVPTTKEAADQALIQAHAHGDPQSAERRASR